MRWIQQVWTKVKKCSSEKFSSRGEKFIWHSKAAANGFLCKMPFVTESIDHNFSENHPSKKRVSMFVCFFQIQFLLNSILYLFLCNLSPLFEILQACPDKLSCFAAIKKKKKVLTLHCNCWNKYGKVEIILVLRLIFVSAKQSGGLSSDSLKLRSGTTPAGWAGARVGQANKK